MYFVTFVCNTKMHLFRYPHIEFSKINRFHTTLIPRREEVTVSSCPFYCVPGQLAREALTLAHSAPTTLLLPARNGSFSIDNIRMRLFCRPFCLVLTLRVFLQISFRKSNKQYVGFKRYIGLGRPKKINEMYIIRRKRRTNFPKNN